MTTGIPFEVGALPRTFQGVNSGGSPVDLFTINADGSITFLTAIDPLDASLVNFGVTSTAAELNLNDNAIASISWAVTAGAANICILTGTIKDAAGATIAAVRELEVYISEAATGIGVTADTYSTGASITTGTLVAALTANKVWRLLTHTTGGFAISITDTAKPADQYAVAVNPISRALHVSAASAALWGA